MSSSENRPPGRPRGSKTKRSENRAVDGVVSKENKRKTEGQQRQTKLRANADSKFYTRNILPGFHPRLPPAAQDLVERALLDHDLADPSAYDPRWVKLYDELHRLIEQPAEATAVSTINEQDDNDCWYEWAPSSSLASDQEQATQPDSTRKSDLKSVLPNPCLTRATHRYISEQLTNARGTLPKHIPPQSCDPNALSALSILLEELVKSQARFNAQRTMFAKSPRNQILAAKREADKKKSGKGKGEP